MAGGKESERKKRAKQDEWITRFIANGCNIEGASRDVGISKKTAYLWKRSDTDFIARLEERLNARQQVLDSQPDEVKEFVALAKEKLKRALASPFTDEKAALAILEAYEPEIYDPRIRFKIWEQRQLLQVEQSEPVTVFRRSKEPLRLELVKPEKAATGTDGQDRDQS
jgi:hypothetical protein